MSFSINSKLSFIDSFQFLSSSLDSIVRNLKKDDFNFLSQEFNNNMSDLVNQKCYFPYQYVGSFDKIKEQLPSKEKF